MKRRFNIKVLGQEFSVLSDTGDDHVANIVQYVNGKAEEIGRTSKNATTLDIAILVALNIADEYFKFKGEKESIFNKLEDESNKLINYIEETI